MAHKNLTRKQREFLRHRKEIMQTALSLFSQKGFANVSMQEIALKSEFAVGTLYKFFSTKEALYSEVFKEKVFELHSILVKALNIPGNEIKKMKTFIEKKIQWFTENMDYVRLYVTEIFGVGYIDKEEFRQLQEKNHVELVDEICRLFNSGIKKKIFKQSDPQILAISLNGLSNGLLFEMIENRDFKQIDPNSVLTIFLQSICLKGADEVV